jgi:prolipoprotein diacylglyceryltransferase
MYDLILATIFFFIFRYLQKNLNLGSGSWIGLWAIWYGVQRMILDTLRFGMGDATIGNFTWNQIGGATLAVIGLIVFFRFKNIRTG